MALKLTSGGALGYVVFDIAFDKPNNEPELDTSDMIQNKFWQVLAYV